MFVKPGHGYYDLDVYPLGGKFCRASDYGLEIVNIISRHEKSLKSYETDTIGLTNTGRKVAFDSAHADAGETTTSVTQL